jgi:hypothetical protein
MEEGHNALEESVWEEGELDWDVLLALMLFVRWTE